MKVRHACHLDLLLLALLHKVQNAIFMDSPDRKREK